MTYPDLNTEYTITQVKHKSIKGIKWVGIGETIVRFLHVAATIILARLLGPEIFGSFAICLICFRLMNSIGDLGFSAVIVQKKKVESNQLDSILVLCFVFCVISTLFIYFSANIVEAFFKYENLSNSIRYFSFIFLCVPINAVYRSIFVRDMRFFSLTLIEVVSFLLNISISLLLAFQGKGIWALIAGLYLESISQTFLFLIYGKWKPRLRIDFNAISESLNFASKVMFARIGYFFNTNIDNLLIGKFLGQHFLGIYLIAYSLIDMPVQRISKNVAKVAFPTLSKFQDNMSEFKKAYRTSNYLLSIIILPLFIGLFIVADDFCALLYGFQWMSMVTPLRMLCFAGIFRSFLVLSSTSLLALDKPGLEVGIAYVQGLLIFLFTFLLLGFGLDGVSVAVSVAYAIGFVISLVLLLPHVEMQLQHYLTLILYPCLAAGAMVSTWFVNLYLIGDHLDTISLLILNICTCSFAFLFSIWFMDRSVFSYVHKIITAR